MNEARQKEELYGLIALYGLFVAALIAVDIFYSAWGQMPAWLIVLAVIAHLGVLLSTVKLLEEWKDPKHDRVRKYFFVFFLAAIGLVAGFRVAKNEFNMFQGDVDKAKQEQLK